VPIADPRASLTAFTVSSGSIWKTPKPSCGMMLPSFKVMLGIALTVVDLLHQS
jgi:hypothetical protein